MSHTTSTAMAEELEALRATLERQRAEMQRQAAALAARDATIASLHEQIRLLLARRFAPSSERMVDGQLGLFDEAEAEEAKPETEATGEAVAVDAHVRRRGKRTALPEYLPRVDVVHELPEAERVCPHDGSILERFGEETSEQLDIIPAKVQVLRHVRAKYRCRCCAEHVVTAPLAPQPLPKSLASPGLLAYVATAKFVDGLPLYRQTEMLRRIDVELPRQTLARWMVRCGRELAQPLVNLLRDELLAAPYLHMDETTVQVLKEPGRPAQSTSYMWCQVSGSPERPIVLFDYDASRSGAVPKRLLGEFSGYLHTDGYEGYSALVQANGITQLYCFAHARRRFVDGLKALGIHPRKPPTHPPDKARRLLQAVRFIQTLYAIERRIRGRPPQARQAVRDAESRPVLDALREWMEETLPRVAPKTPLGQALGYLHRHWDGLTRFLDDGRLEIDNNRAENAIRPFVVGRKAWLFADTVHGAQASANLYSLVETAKANGLEPYAYLRHVFTELPKARSVEELEALLPTRLDPERLRDPAPP
jgi:transposase